MARQCLGNGSIAPRVTIGLPVFNGEAYLGEALDSLLSQSFTDFEIVISDNASTDLTQEICERYAQRDERVRYFRQAVNRGAAANYNRTFELSRGELFKWAAHDDRCATDFLARCVAALDAAGSKAVLAYCPARTIDEKGAPLHPDPYVDGDALHPRGGSPPLRLVHTLQRLDMVNAIFGVIRSEVLATTRLIDAFIASDYVLMVELALRGEFVRLDDRLLERRKHPDGSRQEANPTLAHVAAWFDGGTVDRVVMPPRLRLTFEYVRSSLSAPITMPRRVACAALVVPCVVAVRARVFLGRHRRRIVAARQKRVG
jgi:glycosyltransferase involved in cell wall biosynthesis